MDRSPSTSVGLLAATALALGGCVTTVEPRAYLPVVQPPPTDIAAFERDFSACASQVSEDAAVFYRSHPELKAVKEGDLEFTPVGGGVGPGDMGAGVIGLIELVIIAGQASSRSQARQAHRQATEMDIQAAMTSCLKARGHTVADWRLVQAASAPATTVRTPTQPAGRALLVQEAQQAERLAESDPKQRTASLRAAAERYDRVAEGAGDPQERARWAAKAAEARRKADEPGPSSMALRMPAYAATPGASALSEAPKRTFSVEAARDARPGSGPASRIYETYDVHTVPAPARLLQDVFSAELAAAGHRPSSETPDVRIVPEMRRFDLWDQGKFWSLHTDVNGEVEVTVRLEAPQQSARSRDYSAKCTGRIGGIVSPKVLSRIVADCLREVGAQFRQDAAVRDFLASAGPQR